MAGNFATIKHFKCLSVLSETGNIALRGWLKTALREKIWSPSLAPDLYVVQFHIIL